jgi:hypothetical protein
MGLPVSIEMTAFQFVQKGLPDPQMLLVNPDDLTPEEWRELINDELFWLRKLMKDLKGFRKLDDVIEKDLTPLIGHVRKYDGSDYMSNTVCRVMDVLPPNSGQNRFLLLTKDGGWLMWACRTRWQAIQGGRHKVRMAERARVVSLDDEAFLALLASGPRFGLDVLKSLVRMVDETIADRQERVDVLKTYRNMHIGQSLGRLNAWK